MTLASQETDGLQVGPGTNTGQYDDVFLLPLETIDGVEVNCAQNLFAETPLESSLHLHNLSAVHRDDANLAVEGDGHAVLDESVVQGHRDLNLGTIDERVSYAAAFFRAGLDIEEAICSKLGVFVPRPFGLLCHARAILEAAAIEDATRQLADVGVHTILDASWSCVNDCVQNIEE